MKRCSSLLIQCQLLARTSVATQIFSPIAGAQIMSRRNAGHSHWANIKHIKGAKDKVIGELSIRVASMVRLALRDQANPDPKINTQLRRAIDFGQNNNLPLKSIQAMITKTVASRDKMVLTRFDVKGPAGSIILFDVSSENSRRAKNIVSRAVAKRFAGTLLDSGGSRHFFDEKGIIIVEAGEGNKDMTLAEVEDIAISAEAEDVKPVEGSDPPNFQIICDPESIYAVIKSIQSTELKILEQSVLPIPTDLVTLSDEQKTAVDSGINAVKSHDEVTVENVFDNIDW